MAVIIDGNAVASIIKERVRQKVAALKKPPSLAVVLVGSDPGSLAYIAGKFKACEETGITSTLYELDEGVSQGELLALIERLNNDANIDAILPQQPFPPHIDARAVVCMVDPAKDVDCLHPYNMGLVMAGEAPMPSCTPSGVITMLDESGIKIEGKDCVVLGRSDVVGKPIAMLLMKRNATVTICHSKTADLESHTRRADILVAAIRRPKFVTARMIKEGAAVIDVGINRLGGKKICGDVDYKDCFDKAGFITRVPGGVGPVTVATLMENCLKASTLRDRRV